jgi:hypothetical protein
MHRPSAFRGQQMRDEAPSAVRPRPVSINSRREAMYMALAAAEVCWAAPIFLLLTQAMVPHPPLPLWLAMLALLLGFFYLYRAMSQANLSLRLQQSLLVVALLLSIVLMHRFHVYSRMELQGLDWFLQPFRSLFDLTAVIPLEFIAALTLVHLWARGIHLARRSLSVDSVGFSFRSGVIILIVFAWAIGLFTGKDISPFVVAYFFFALVAVALARIERVSRSPNSGGVGFGGFWIGSTLAAVALLIVLGTVVATVFHGGGLEQVLRWLSPVFVVLQVLLVGLALLIFGLVELIMSLLPVDWSGLLNRLQAMIEGFRRIGVPPSPLTGDQAAAVLPVFGALRAMICVAVIVLMILLVLLFTWWRMHRERDREAHESRESLFSTGALARNLLSMLQSGRDRLGQLMGLVDQFGLGSRLLSAITIRRIYANLVRLATRFGYPRTPAQTPYEYLETLCKAFPGQDADVALITEAYVSSHYGKVPDGREELERIRQCWARVQAQGVKKRDPGP